MLNRAVLLQQTRTLRIEAPQEPRVGRHLRLEDHHRPIGPLLGFRRVLIGERRSFQGAEQWLEEAGIAVECLNDPACEALMQTMLQKKPELWAEDIGQ